MSKHGVFISYHHDNDQWFKNELLRLNYINNIFIDGSVDTGDIDDNLTDEQIREIIRDDYLKDTVVTILLVGTETRRRKHIDWEIYSSMFDGKKNKKSGIIVINLPSTGCLYFTASHNGEKEKIYPENTNWVNVTDRNEYERRYPFLPPRIIDNLLKTEAKVSITNWDRIHKDIDNLEFLIEKAYLDKSNCKYDLSQPMRRTNS